jgi:hypothetical protein
LVKKFELPVMGGVEGEESVHWETLRESMGQESGKWGLCMHKGVPLKSAWAIEPITGGGTFGKVKCCEFPSRGVSWSFKSNKV